MKQLFSLKYHSTSLKNFDNADTFKRIKLKSILIIVILGFVFNTLQAQVNLNNGLVAFLPFNGSANDLSGNGNNGIVNGAILTTGRFGNPDAAYSFDGQNDFINVPHSQTLNIINSISISIWIQYNEGNASTYEDIVMKGNNAYGFQFSSSGGQIMFHILSGGWKNLSSQVVPENNKWYHVVGTYDGATQKIYVNGELKAQASWSGKIGTSSDPLYFGYKVAGDNNWYNGILSDFRLYNRAISEEEIKELFNETAIKGIYNISPQSAATSENFSDITLYAYPITSESSIKFINGENSITPDSILERNTYTIKARFSFKNKPLGVYGALMISANDTMKLEKCFSLVYRSEAIEPTDLDNDGLRNISSFGNVAWISQHNESWSWNYELDNDIDADETANWNEGKGLTPITGFSGTIDGQGHKLRYFRINRSDEDNVAFIGQLNSSGIIRNLGLINCNIKGKNNVSSFVGKNNGGLISNCYSTGVINGNEVVGGLVGYNAGTIKHSYNAALVTGVKNIGGLVGNSNNSSILSKNYNIGKVIGSGNNIGGLMGTCYGLITDCYNSGSVVGSGEVAGIAGWNYGTISNTYNRGYINGTGNYCGAMIGYQSGSIANSFWDKENSGLTTSNGGTGKTAAEMKTQSTYSNWDFTSTWEILSTINDNYPQLSWSTTTGLIKSYAPDRVADSGIFTITFEGVGFSNSMNISLCKNGQDTLRADTVYTSDTYCSAQFNFNNTALGAWDIMVEYPDTTVTIKDGLTVEEKKEGKLDIELLGADQFRAGRSTTVTVRITNIGNIEVENPFIFIAIDSEDTTFTVRSLSSFIQDSIVDQFNTMNLDIKDFSFLKTGNLLGHENRLCKLGIFVFPTISAYGSCDFSIEFISKKDIAISAWQQLDCTVDDFLNSISYKNSTQILKTTEYNCISTLGNCVSGVIGTTLLKGNLFSLFNTGVLMGFFAMDQSATNLGIRPNSIKKDLGMLILSTAGSIALTASAPEIVAAGVVLTGAVIFAQCYDGIVACKPAASNLMNIIARGSFDPNDKIGFRSPCGSRYFNADKSNFTYVINFENKETATAAAQEIFVTDTLDLSVFDIESFKAGSINIGKKTFDTPSNVQEAKWTIDMRPEKDLITYVTLTLNKGLGVAHWYFHCVDPVTLDWPQDPTAGFLPPDDSTGKGQGSVSFTINLKEGVSEEVTLNNHATIVFDSNDPIVTPTWSNKKDKLPPSSHMNEPVIVASNHATLSWKGEDNKNGSGVYCYNLFVKKETDEGYSQILTRSVNTSIDFEFEEGVNYSFYTTAIDSAENAEIKVNLPDIVLNSQAELVKVYPNPTNIGKEFNIVINDTDSNLINGSLIVSSITGQIILEKTGLQHEMKLNLRSRGCYLLEIKLNNKNSVNKKIIVD